LLPSCDYSAYKAWFDGEHSKLVLPDDCREVLPPATRRTTEISLVWTLEWILEFADGKYLRVQEHFNKIRGLIGLSRRQAFAYHYGPFSLRGSGGIPERNSNDPVDLRIDTSDGPAHMHFGAPLPHIGQDKVEGLDMESLDMFVFIHGVLAHRKSGKPLDKVLRFRIK
jgi:hypothetical protein